MTTTHTMTAIGNSCATNELSRRSMAATTAPPKYTTHTAPSNMPCLERELLFCSVGRMNRATNCVSVPVM